MSSVRSVKSITSSKPTLEGAGVHLKRAFGYYEVPQYDPFLLLDYFGSDNPAALKRSPMYSTGAWSTATASETAASLAPETCSG